MSHRSKVVVALWSFVLSLPALANHASAQQCRVLNIPRFEAKPMADRAWPGDRGHDLTRAGIAWFGQFDKNRNYAETRVSYDSEGIVVHVLVADLYVWWILDNGVQWGGQLMGAHEQWDAMELAFDASSIGGQRLRFLVANYPYNDPTGHPETALPHLATKTWSWSGSEWVPLSDPISANRVWYHQVNSAWTENPGPNNNTTMYDTGTVYYFYIPWSSLGLTSEPRSGATLSMTARLHDVDDPRDADTMNMNPPASASGSTQVGPLPEMLWPESGNIDMPSTWATLILNQAPYTPPAVQQETTTTLLPRDVPTMRDVSVGGHAFIESRWTEGGGSASDYSWEGCMQTRFGESTNLIVHPEGGPTHLCFFSRALFFYDLGSAIPDGDVIRHAELKLFHFGGDANENPGSAGFDPLPSPMQVHRLEGDWLDLPLSQGVTWNTAPLAAENAGFGTVTPDIPTGANGKYVTFDVTPLVARAHGRHESLNFALYGADMTANTGKYFVSSEGGWEEANKPTLIIAHGPPSDPSMVPDTAGCTIGVAASLFPVPGTGTPDNPVPPNTTPGDGSGTGTPASDPAHGIGGTMTSINGGCGCRIQTPSQDSEDGVLAVIAIALLLRVWTSIRRKRS